MRLGDLHRPDRGRKVRPRAHPIPDLVQVSLQIGLELVQRLPIHSRGTLVRLDLPPRFPNHQLGNLKRLVLQALACSSRFLPEPTAPVDRNNIPGEPAPSLHPHPSEQATSQLLRAGPPASAASVLNAFGFLPRHAPSRDRRGLRPRSPYRRSPSHVPYKSRRPGSRRLYAGHRLANTRAPARLISKDTPEPPISMPSERVSTPQQRTLRQVPPAERFWNVFLVPT